MLVCAWITAHWANCFDQKFLRICGQFFHDWFDEHLKWHRARIAALYNQDRINPGRGDLLHRNRRIAKGEALTEYVGMHRGFGC